jgi:L-lactate dehydrogenase complex protein LldG
VIGEGASEVGRREHGDRAAFLGRIRSRQGPPPAIGPHPPPPAPDVVPEVRFLALDGLDHLEPAALVPRFTAAATAVAATVHGPGVDLQAVVAEVVEVHDVRRAVRSAEAEVAPVAEALAALGVDVAPYEPTAGAAADLGVTSAVAGIAATGSVVVDAAVAGGRGASLLPTVHLCVLPVERLVATPSDVLRRGARPLPSNRVLITGPSRTGDIEQIITLGAHGPVAVHIVLV